ncbi:MAG: hypothetical protein ACOC2H_10600 [Spirochaetota bacterium]
MKFRKGTVITVLLVLVLLMGISLFFYFRYFFTFEQKNIVKRKIETITGMDLTVTIFDVNGKIVKRWYNVKKITSGTTNRSYTYFYTQDNKYVQIPNSVWYIAEEE